MSADYSSTGMGTVKCDNATLKRRLTRQQVQRDAAVSHKIAAAHANASPLILVPRQARLCSVRWHPRQQARTAVNHREVGELPIGLSFEVRQGHG